jgi:RND superfamily putative drug exporter
MFSVLFGLSTDYEVYLVSRIQEEWQRRRHDTDHQVAPSESLAVRHNHQAITIGQAKSGKIIAAAATIMVLVFGSFLLSGDRILQEFGFGLAFAVLIDALIIRSLLVPAIMHRIGPANWAMPAWLDRIVPNLSIEAGDDSDGSHGDAPATGRDDGGEPADAPRPMPSAGDEPVRVPEPVMTRQAVSRVSP